METDCAKLRERVTRNPLRKGMKKIRTVKQKVRGRPRTDMRPLIGFRADDAARAAVVKWAESQSDIPTLSEAIRRLVELGLTVKARSRQQRPERAEKANKMAADQLDQLVDKAASAEEQADRREHLLKGPEEFRRVQVDRSRAKER